MSAYQINSTFDPYAQTFTLLAPDGVTQVSGSMSELLALQANVTGQGIVNGIQIGLSALLLTILMLMTKSDKRRSSVFLLNSGALLLVLIRGIVYCLELFDLFYNYYNWQLYWYPSGQALQHAMNCSMTAEIFSLLIDVLIYASLVLQVHIVCCTLDRWQQLLVLFGGIFVALVAVSVRITLAVMNIKWFVLGIDNYEPWQRAVFDRLISANNIITVVSIAIYSTAFLVKLAFAIMLRRKLHMKQFGPMQIIFVMGCQTLFIPLIFAIITYFVATGVQLNSFASTLVAIFLPLSGMWASANTAQRHQLPADRHNHRDDSAARAIPVGGRDFASAKAYGVLSDGSSSSGGTKRTDTTLTSTLIDERELLGSGSEGSARGKSRSEASEDVEMQQVLGRGGGAGGAGIDVSRTFSIRSD